VPDDLRGEVDREALSNQVGDEQPPEVIGE